MTIGPIINKLVGWWPKLPKELRFVLGVGILGGLLTGGAVIGYMAWRDGYVQQKIDGFIGRDELKENLDAQFITQADTLAAVAGHGTREIRRFMKDTLAVIRKNAKDSLLDPLAVFLTTTNERLRALESNQAALSDQVEEIPRPDNDALYDVLDAIKGQPSNAEILRLLRAQTDSLQMMKEHLGRKKGNPIKL